MAPEPSRRRLFRAIGHGIKQHDGAAPKAKPVAVIAENCMELQGVMCRRCGDECEARAISFRPAPRHRVEITLSHSACTGCGDCVGVCPVGAISLKEAEA